MMQIRFMKGEPRYQLMNLIFKLGVLRDAYSHSMYVWVPEGVDGGNEIVEGVVYYFDRQAR